MRSWVGGWLGWVDGGIPTLSRSFSIGNYYGLSYLENVRFGRQNSSIDLTPPPKSLLTKFIEIIKY